MKSCWRFFDGVNLDVGEKGVVVLIYFVLVFLMGYFDCIELYISIFNIIIMELNKKKKKNVFNYDIKYICFLYEF